VVEAATWSANRTHRRHFVELLKEKGNAPLAWKADLIDGAGGIWTQCNDLKASMS
jgi:hypothetical protein